MARTGRPSKYSAKLAARICAAIADGNSLMAVCRKAGMPTRETVRVWLRERADFLADFARAREERADVRADQIDKAVQDMRKGKLDPQAARVEIEARKWQAGVEAPRKYSPRVEVAGDADAPLAIVVKRLDRPNEQSGN